MNQCQQQLIVLNVISNAGLASLMLYNAQNAVATEYSLLIADVRRELLIAAK